MVMLPIVVSSRTFLPENAGMAAVVVAVPVTGLDTGAVLAGDGVAVRVAAPVP
jgi:hypothetical protein